MTPRQGRCFLFQLRLQLLEANQRALQVFNDIVSQHIRRRQVIKEEVFNFKFIFNSLIFFSFLVVMK